MGSYYFNWRGHKVTQKELLALNYIVDENRNYGVTTDEARHLFEGDAVASRRTLHRLAKKNLLKKKTKKRPCEWNNGRGQRKVAYFYPIEENNNG